MAGGVGAKVGRGEAQEVKTAIRTINGMYVTIERPATMRHRERHDLASAHHQEVRGRSLVDLAANAPCSTCGSSRGTAFSVSEPPTCLVRGIGRKDAIHQRGKSMKPMKNIQACNEDAGSSSVLRWGVQGVACIRGGRPGSRI